MGLYAKQVDFLLTGYRDPNTGKPLSGGKVYTYLDGTSTLSNLWTDRNKSAEATNPIILDAQGRAEVYGDNIYKFVIKSANDELIETINGVELFVKEPPPSIVEWLIRTDSISYKTANQIDIIGDVTAEYHVDRRIKVQGETTGIICGVIKESTYVPDVTTVTIAWDSGHLSNEELTVWLAFLRGDYKSYILSGGGGGSGSENDDWLLRNDVISYLAANKITIIGDVTIEYHKKRKIKIQGETTGTIYGIITDSIYSADEDKTTVTIAWDSGELFNEELTVWLALIKADHLSFITPADEVLLQGDNPYYSLERMVDVIGSEKKTLVIYNTQTLTKDLIIPANISLHILQGGEINGDFTLTINGPFKAGLYKVFNCGTVTFGYEKVVYPEWWGGYPDIDTPEGRDACKVAFEAAYASSAKIIELNVGTYHMAAGIKHNVDGVTLRGKGSNNTRVKNYNTIANDAVITVGKDTEDLIGFNIEDLAIEGTIDINTALYLKQARYGQIARTYIEGSKLEGIKLDGVSHIDLIQNQIIGSGAVESKGIYFPTNIEVSNTYIGSMHNCIRGWDNNLYFDNDSILGFNSIGDTFEDAINEAISIESGNRNIVFIGPNFKGIFTKALKTTSGAVSVINASGINSDDLDLSLTTEESKRSDLLISIPTKETGVYDPNNSGSMHRIGHILCDGRGIITCDYQSKVKAYSSYKQRFPGTKVTRVNFDFRDYDSQNEFRWKNAVGITTGSATKKLINSNAQFLPTDWVTDHDYAEGNYVTGPDNETYICIKAHHSNIWLVDLAAQYWQPFTYLNAQVCNESDDTYTYITAVDSNTQLSVNDHIFGSNDIYYIYHSEFIAKTTGYYQVNVAIHWATETPKEVFLKKNNNSVAYAENSQYSVTLSDVLFMNVNDKLYVDVLNNDSYLRELFNYGFDTYISIHKLS